MGTQVQWDSYLHYSTRDLNEDSNSCSWRLYYGDKSLANGQYYNGFPPRSMVDVDSAYDKDVVRKTILKHEAIFKSQVYELHRLYGIQRELMDDLKRKTLNRNWTPIETSLSSSPLASQITCEDTRKWQLPNFSLPNNPVHVRSSISGVEDKSLSPMSERKRSNSQAGPVPSRLVDSSNDTEILEVRPNKVGRKMIDLRLPADEYIDIEEITEIKGITVCGTSSNLLNESLKAKPWEDSSRPSAGSRSTNGMVDLNEPVKFQETDSFSYGYSHASRNGEIRGQELCDGRKTQSVASSREISLTSLHRRKNLAVNYPYSEGNGTRKGGSPKILATGNYASSQKSASLFLQPDKSPYSSHLATGNYASSQKSASLFRQPDKSPYSSQPMKVLFNNSQEPPGFSLGDQSKVDSWRERTFIDLEAETEDHEIFHDNNVESYVVSNARCSHSVNFPDSAGPWNHLHSSRENPSNISAQIHPFLNLPESLRNNHPRNGLLRVMCRSEKNSRANPSSESSSCPNGTSFYHGSSSLSKEYSSNFPSICYNFLNGRSDCDAAMKNLNNHHYKNTNGSEMKFVRDVNLNVALANGSVNEARKIEEQTGTLPWLKPKPVNEIIHRRSDLNMGNSCVSNSYVSHLVNKDDPCKSQIDMWSQNLKSVSYSSDIETKKVGASHRVLDINMPCEPAFAIPEEDRLTDNRAEAKVSESFRPHIDLNLSVSEDEESFTPVGTRWNAKLIIDLEAPAVLDTEEDDVCGEKPQEESLEETLTSLDELVQIAAEAIVAISSSFGHHSDSDNVACFSPEASVNILDWFAETIHNYGENLDKKLDTFSENKGDGNKEKSFSLEEIDYFELMTLKLDEITENEYMPKPLVPENLEFDESRPAVLPSHRGRRGNPRRGRQRRDFQRDILPGLASLSRDEVTEDLQTFGELMRARGYDWNSGLTRKKTGSTRGRGRPRLVKANAKPPDIVPPFPVCPSPSVQQLNDNNVHNSTNIELGLEARSFAGWGKMTSRPRRQRCPPGNNRKDEKLGIATSCLGGRR